MSQFTHQTVQCPHCGATSTATLWQSVNVTLDPELKEKLFSRELLEHTCPNCGRTSNLFYPLLYHDQDARVMIWLIPPDEQGNPRLEPFTLNAHIHLLSGYRLRLVVSVNELLEKIMIFDQNLDDRVVELMKEMLWQDGATDPAYPRHLFFFSEMLVDSQGERQLVLVQLQPPNQPYAFRVGWDDGYQAAQDLLFGEYGVSQVDEAGWKRVDHQYARSLIGGG